MPASIGTNTLTRQLRRALFISTLYPCPYLRLASIPHLIQGQQAIFQYRVSWKKNAAVKSVTLESGDALIFGGRSRGIIHRIPRVGTAVVSPEPGVLGVPDLTAGQLRPGFDVPEAGRYNLNFREL